jgi:hypothetical protein
LKPRLTLHSFSLLNTSPAPGVSISLLFRENTAVCSEVPEDFNRFQGGKDEAVPFFEMANGCKWQIPPFVDVFFPTINLHEKLTR